MPQNTRTRWPVPPLWLDVVNVEHTTRNELAILTDMTNSRRPPSSRVFVDVPNKIHEHTSQNLPLFCFDLTLYDLVAFVLLHLQYGTGQLVHCCVD